MPRRNILVIFFLILVAVLCRSRIQTNPYVRVLASAIEKIEANALEPVDEKAMFEGAMNGMLAQFDDNSRYFSPEEFRKFTEAVELQFGGIGVQIGIDPKTKELLVLSPVANSPAAKAGILAGDKILKIEGIQIRGISLNDAHTLIHGKKGKPVTLTVQHAGEEKPCEITIIREIVQGDSVWGDTRNPDGSWEFFLDGHDHIGYIRLAASFSGNTVNELRQALAWVKQQRLRGLVLDLRDNPGGFLDAGVGVCNLLIKSGKIVTTKGRKTEDIFEADGSAPFTDFPIAVLVNGDTASAAEIVSACLQDNHRAKVFGQRSYGKGTVQELVPLENGCGGMKLTTKSFWRPSGRPIQRPKDASNKGLWGVSPDEGCKVELTEEETNQWRKWRRDRDVHAGNNKPFVDRQRQRAVEYVEKEAANRESQRTK